MVWGASLATGIVWLFLGLTGTARYVTKLINRPFVLGIILGLGFGFMIEGAKTMAQNWWVGGIALLGTSLLLTNRVIPAMFLLLLFGAAFGILSDQTLLAALREVHMEPRPSNVRPERADPERLSVFLTDRHNAECHLRSFAAHAKPALQS